MQESQKASTFKRIRGCLGKDENLVTCTSAIALTEGGVKVCGDVVSRYFWCDFAEIFISARVIEAFQD